MDRGLLAFLIMLGLLVGMSPALAEKRVALIIGNNSYATLKDLRNARKDAQGVDAKLKTLGFETILRLDVKLRDMGRTLDQFEAKLAKADVGLVFYAGHGIQANGRNYLIPSDALVETETDLEFGGGVPVRKLLDRMMRAGTALNIVILDACRDNPLPTRSGSRGLVVEVPPAGMGAKGTAILYSAAPGQVALDGPKGGHGVFTGELLRVLDQPGLKLEDVFKKTAAQVASQTNGKQDPWINSSVKGDFYFKPGQSKPAQVALLPPASTSDRDTEFWTAIKDSSDKADFEAYLSQFPKGTYAYLAKKRIKELSEPEYVVASLNTRMWVSGNGAVNVRVEPTTEGANVGRLEGRSEVRVTGLVEDGDWYRVDLPTGVVGYVYSNLLTGSEPQLDPAHSLSPGDTFRDCENAYVATAGRYAPSGAFCGPEMVVIPSGSFQMGSNDGDDNEKPVHRVNIGYQFAVGKYEVTQAEWQAVMGSNPSYFKGSNQPVERVSWEDAQTFIEKLNRKTGQRYRLLSESEWEYVARAGTTTTYSWGNSAGSGNANCYDCGSRWDNKETAPVGSFRANPFGVHDMHGNVWEWVQDCKDSYANTPTDGSAIEGNNSCFRVLRGGSWVSHPWDLRSAIRFRGRPDVRSSYLGFRLARTL
ncbi:SUMF1/EgtB/PvdO family nonheme iron enzyme [Magnetospira thiophila]